MVTNATSTPLSLHTNCIKSVGHLIFSGLSYRRVSVSHSQIHILMHGSKNILFHCHKATPKHFLRKELVVLNLREVREFQTCPPTSPKHHPALWGLTSPGRRPRSRTSGIGHQSPQYQWGQVSCKVLASSST